MVAVVAVGGRLGAGDAALAQLAAMGDEVDEHAEEGTTRMKSVHAAFAQPDRSSRPKTSERMMTSVQIQATQKKKITMVQKMSKNG